MTIAEYGIVYSYRWIYSNVKVATRNQRLTWVHSSIKGWLVESHRTHDNLDTSCILNNCIIRELQPIKIDIRGHNLYRNWRASAPRLNRVLLNQRIVENRVRGLDKCSYRGVVTHLVGKEIRIVHLHWARGQDLKHCTRLSVVVWERGSWYDDLAGVRHTEDTTSLCRTFWECRIVYS